ncbi:MAG: globin [Litoreibacter sp.]|nr:globin [Litoreibacter sp.]
MHLSDEEIELVRKGFDMARSEDLFTESARFYENLFKRAPRLRHLFRDDLEGQGMRFMTTLRTVVVTMNDPDALHRELRPLGHLHSSIGIHPEDFEPMGEALMDTFRDTLGDDFTPEMEASWRKAYGMIAEKMMELGQIR